MFDLQKKRNLHKSNFLEVIIKMTANASQQKYSIHLLEIITLIVRDQVGLVDLIFIFF